MRKEKELESLQEEYTSIKIPQQGKEKMQEAIKRAKADNQKEDHQKVKRLKTFPKIGIVFAAALCIFVAIPNSSAKAAEAVRDLPVIGGLFKVVTFRNFTYESERFEANAEVPHIVQEDVETKVPEQDEQAKEQLQNTVDSINFDIDQVTNQLIKEFEESAELEESYGALDIQHEVATDNDRYFTLKLSVFQAAGSGVETYHFYTIDKITGEQISIGDLFKEGTDYQSVISENIKDQMRTLMAEDDMYTYWVDYEEVPEWNWQGITENQNFYFDENDNLVIVFDEYEVAPGFMGAQEFTVEKSVFADLLK